MVTYSSECIKSLESEPCSIGGESHRLLRLAREGVGVVKSIWAALSMMTSPRGQEDRRTTSRPVSLETGALELNQFVLLGKQVIEGLEVFCKSAGSCTRGYSFWVSEYGINKWIQIMKREYPNLYSNPDGSWTTPLLPTSCAPTWGVRRRRAREVFTNSNTARSSIYQESSPCFTLQWLLTIQLSEGLTLSTLTPAMRDLQNPT